MRRGRYYTPPAEIRAVPGVEHVIGRGPRDEFKGSAEALAATGLVSLDMFPGQPGLPVATVTYRPGERKGDGGWWSQPGYLTIYRMPSGPFRIVVTVSLAEQTRRAAEHDRVEEERNARWEARARERAAAQQADLELTARVCKAAVEATLGALRAASPTEALREMGVEHRRRLPPGWRLIVGTLQETRPTA